MTRPNDIIVIGAGHNGLVCANYLARTGLKVIVLEASESPGGMMATRTLGSAYQFPGLAHTAYPLNPAIVGDLKLTQFGYSNGKTSRTVVLGQDGRHLSIDGDTISAQGLAATDAEAWPRFRKRYLDFARSLKPLFEQNPPRLKDMDFGDKTALAKLGWNLRMGLGKDEMYEFLRVAAINIYDVLNDEFEDDRLKGAIAADAVMGSAMGPRTPGTVLTWLQRLYGELNGALSVSTGGIIDALVQAAEDGGVHLRTGAAGHEILIENDKAIGVRLADGERVKAKVVISNADPRTTFSRMVGAPRLDAMFANRVSQIRGSGVVGKLHIALNGRPQFTNLPEPSCGDRLLVAPSMRYVEHAFNPSKYGEVPEHPMLEVTMPSVHEPTLAPEGHHVMSVNVAFLPYSAEGGWQQQQSTYGDRIISLLGQYAPDLTSMIVDHEFLTPADVEAQYQVAEGHWHHGELSIHQSFMMRPVHGAAQYDTPIDKLYLCGAGCHPGGGITGLPGRAAAKRVIEMGAAK